MEVSIGYWIGFFVFIVVMLALDLGVFHRTNEAPTIKSSLLWSGFWIGLAFAFAGGIWLLAGGGHALDFITAYLLEKSLSIDNIFIFILVFNFFKIDLKYQHRLLFWGVFGALIMRVIFIFAGVVLLDKFKWLMIVFGLFLVFTGIKMLFDKEESGDLNNNMIIKTLRRLFPFKEDAPVAKFLIKVDGKTMATQFLIALLFIEASDLIFAVDSIPAVLSVSQNSFIVVTSNIFAIMGLRSLYFAVSGILPLFRYIKYALSVILAFIGFKMVLNEAAHYFNLNLHISNMVSLVVIISLITLSIVASIIADKVMKRKQL
ncbi:TerC/Alx family metal homeostasis membrane protein [Paucilactobacillus wasatchensis]|uniref:Integral membrane protein n=1 Tax=Paucilactobacillus wasatchensis TaxID=1335616 RepID=A0A0D0YX77_9LACO|nr:TerC/Alx family metal homeostasis membrane protein [Paucilactobacillus wasatchensis]KIS03844.1 Integral membrane protein [Paucilactobacillus wasatchensis]